MNGYNGEVRRDFLKKICIGIAVMLLASFAVHTIVLDHDHPHNLFGDGVQAFLHGDHKKWWLFVVLLSLAFMWREFLPLQGLRHGVCVGYNWFTRRCRREFDIMGEILREGILHPKLCAR